MDTDSSRSVGLTLPLCHSEEWSASYHDEESSLELLEGWSSVNPHKIPPRTYHDPVVIRLVGMTQCPGSRRSASDLNGDGVFSVLDIDAALRRNGNG